MRAVALGMVLCGLAFISGSDRSFGQQDPRQQPKPQRTLENLLEEPVKKAPPAPPAQEPEASVDLLAVPSEAEVAEAVILIREAYADDYKGEPGVLIKTLKSAAGQTDDSVRKFALLQEGEKTAVGAGDLSQAFELLEKRGSLFKIDVQRSSIALIKKFTKPTGETTKKLVERLLQLSRTSLETDRFPSAKEAADLGVVHARALVAEERVKKQKGDCVALLKELLALQEDITQRSELFGDYEKALATIQKPGAGACEREHTVVGRYRCLASDDWETGLAYLAKGEAGPLRVASSKELLQKSGEKQVPKELLAVAGEWWKLSEKPEDEASLSESDLEKLHEHSSRLYAAALPHLIDPLDRALAIKRSAGAEPPGPKKPTNSIGMELVSIPKAVAEKRAGESSAEQPMRMAEKQLPQSPAATKSQAKKHAIREWVRFVNLKSGHALSIDSPPGKQGTSLRQQPVLAEDLAQQWRLEATKIEGAYILRNRASELVVILKEDKQGEGFLLWPYEEHNKQSLFTLDDIGHGQVKIVSHANGLVMSIWGADTKPGQWVIQWPFAATSNDHRWTVVPVEQVESSRRIVPRR